MGISGIELLIQSWHSGSRSTIEYRPSNIRRIEPPACLFEMPPDYTMDVLFTPGDSWLSFASAESPRAGTFRAATRCGHLHSRRSCLPLAAKDHSLVRGDGWPRSLRIDFSTNMRSYRLFDRHSRSAAASRAPAEELRLS